MAVPWFVLETTGSPAKAGIAAFFTTLPLALAIAGVPLLGALTLAAPVGVISSGFLVDSIGLRPAMLALATANALLAFVFVRPAARGIRVAAEQAV